eukprot:764918_1
MMGNKSNKVENMHQCVQTKHTLIITTNPCISLLKDSKCDFISHRGIFQLKLSDILNPIEQNKFQLYYKLKEEDDWKDSAYDKINGYHAYDKILNIKVPLYIYSYTIHIRIRCQHVATQKYSEFSNTVQITVPSIFTIQFKEFCFRLPLHPVFDLSTHSIKISEYQNILLPRTKNEERNEEILNMFIAISKAIEHGSIHDLQMMPLDLAYYSKSIAKYIIDFVYKSNTDYNPPKIDAFHAGYNEYDMKCNAFVQVLPCRDLGTLSVNCSGFSIKHHRRDQFMCFLCGSRLSYYNWFCVMNHTQCKSTPCGTQSKPYAHGRFIACLSCINQFLQKYMLLYGYLNDILHQKYLMNPNCVQVIVSYTVGNIVLQEKGVWSHVNDTFFDFFL